MEQGDTGVQGDTGMATQGDTGGSTPSVLQVVQSSYAWGNGDMTYGEILDPEDCSPDWIGDGLLEFLIRETSPDEAWFGEDAPAENALEHWEQARYRMEKVLAEVQSVYEALHKYGPQPPG
jgi:hypothetical protein